MASNNNNSGGAGGPDMSLSNPNLPASKQFGAYKVGEFAAG